MGEIFRSRENYPRYQALRFSDVELFAEQAEILDKIAAEKPFRYDVVYSVDDNNFKIILPRWSYKLLTQELKNHGIRYQEVPVIPISDLSPEKQAELRGLKRKL